MSKENAIMLEIVSSNFVTDNLPSHFCHSPTIVEVNPNHLLIAWFGGDYEGSPSCNIWLTNLKNGTWDTPHIVAQGIDNRGKPLTCWNPVLFKVASGRIFLSYKIGKSPSKWEGMMQYSDNKGENWSEAKKLPTSLLGATKNKPLEIFMDVLLCPSSRERAAYFLITPSVLAALADKQLPVDLLTSLNSLQNIRFESVVEFFKELKIKLQDNFFEYRDLIKELAFVDAQSSICIERFDPNRETWEMLYDFGTQSQYQAIQPALFLKDKEVKLLCRSINGFILESSSPDEGRTWRPLQATSLTNPDSGIDAIKLDNNWVLIVRNINHRGVLAVSASLDGSTWEDIILLENKIEGEFSYPAIIKSINGLLYLVYTWNRKNIKFVCLKIKNGNNT